ncbi:hypothetical protein PHMEG_00012149 [Phytophthora megakarya]|uniref:Uncharacterized protein n=1 Tax=Phytophthora megakarya TaxID=4795 RepID=A0A225WB72_9STRA|nr:hypothetical protein PHMEG_00012149 [Phytophthora megakarya]
MTVAPSSSHAVHLSAGFPDYAPNKVGGIHHLKQRFILSDYKPFDKHVRDERETSGTTFSQWFAPRARMALDKYIRFMEENTAGFWHGGHWFAIYSSTPGGADMQRERKRQWDALTRTVEVKQRECIAEGAPSSIFWEAAYWTLLSNPCYWVLMDPRSFSDRSSPYSLAERLEILDHREPARVQWATAALDEELVDHIPKSVSVSLLPQLTRQDNPASRTYY